ncbi:MAG: hypothetical protein ABIH72_01875 [archaeon]
MSLTASYTAYTQAKLASEAYELRQRQKEILNTSRQHTIERGREHFLNTRKQLLIRNLCDLIDKHQ